MVNRKCVRLLVRSADVCVYASVCVSAAVDVHSIADVSLHVYYTCIRSSLEIVCSSGWQASFRFLPTLMHANMQQRKWQGKTKTKAKFNGIVCVCVRGACVCVCL